MIALIHITEKQTGKILDYIPLGDFWDDNHHKSLKDTLEYFEFRTFGDKRYSQHLEKMNRIIIPDEDGTFVEFVIFHAIKYRLQNAVVVDVYAPASYLLLKKAKVIKPQRVSEYTASQHLGFALNGTEWRPGIVESDKYRSLTIENHTNPYAYIKRIANEFELEPRFRVETDGNKVIGRYVDLLERVGQWQGREVEFGRDLLGIERKVDDSNVVTALIGLGPEREDGTRLEVFVEDEEALQRWGIPNPQTGELMHLIETYEPESTDQNMSIERLTELTRNELEKRINSVVEYTADVADLEKVPGMENKKIRFGDTIKIKDTGFNPPLYLEARVHTQDRSLSQPEKKKVTLGDYIEYTEEEVHAIWKQLQAEIAKKVSMAEVTEVVYTKPEVDERDDAVREHADTVAENAKIEAIQVAAEDASKKAKQAEDSAKEYTDGRLENTVAKDIFESTVTDLLNNIAQKVDSTRFEQVESELRGIAEDLQHEVAEHADTLEEHGGKITKLETDVDEVEGKINATISELEALGDTVSRHETQIDANAQAIALKADKQELDLLSGTVSDISSELSVMAGQIEAKAERSEVEKLESDVSKVSQDVSNLTIDVDGIKTNVSSISQTVSNHGTQISNINSTLTQHANMIATKVEQSEFDSVTDTLGNRISTIEQTADSISLEVRDIKANVYTKSEVDGAIDGIQVGGRNLASKNNIGKWIGGWVEDNYVYTITGPRAGLYIKADVFKTGERYVLTFKAKKISGTVTSLAGHCTNYTIHKVIRDGVLQSTNWSSGLGTNPYPDDEEVHHYEIHFTAKDFTDIDNNFYIQPNRLHYGLDYVMKIWDLKLEKGNKATDWTPAPEDVQAQIDDIEGTLASHSTKIEQNAQQIQLRATKTEVDTLTGRVNQAESRITQLAGQIELRATKTEVDALTGRVNTVESTIQQHADLIESKIDDGQARSIFRQEASSFTFEADQINFKGHVFGEDATFVGELSTGIINTNEVYIGKKTLPFWEHFSSRIVMKNVIRITDGEFMEGEPFVIEVGNGDALISTPGSLELIANTVTIPGDIRLSDEGFVYTSAIDNHRAHASPHIYIRPRNADSEVRATVTGTTTEYVKVRAREFVAGGINGDGIFSADNSIAVLRAGPDRIAFVQSDLEVRATRRMQGSSYVPVRASSFPSGSLEEFKTNIKKWEESALDIIRNADIYEFNLKNDLEVGKNKKRYGLVIGDGYRTPEQVVDDDGVEQYAMNSISWKAIQELDTEQQELKGRIAWLEAENKMLREKIKKLEGMIP